ncbi:MAG: hypothetical protein IID46_11715 [Planctomycetes bacterium]|nr:hypothetical protein [Planctomycetota bacterium]
MSKRGNGGIHVRPNTRPDYFQHSNRIVSTVNQFNPVFPGRMTEGGLLQISRFETPYFNAHKPRPKTITLRVRRLCPQEMTFSNQHPNG